jgi:EAL domain-containing protein (putative c-di-GMP-specific phosphodiesterase class I)
MYEAKRRRTGHEVYLPSRDRHSRQRLVLIGELHGALDAGQLVLHYPPKADLATGAIRGVEALVRWQHPQRGLLGPDHFLPLMEHSGLTQALTAFVLDRVIEEIGGLRRHGFDLSVAVNLGPGDLLDLGLPSEVERLLDDRGFGPEHLELEVSEDVVMADVDRTIDVLVGLRAISVRTALDDFGAGQAALGHLHQLEVDTLKIDRSFVMRLGREDRNAAIVHSLVDLGRRLSLRVVAEGWKRRTHGTCLSNGAATRPGLLASGGPCRDPHWRHGCADSQSASRICATLACGPRCANEGAAAQPSRTPRRRTSFSARAGPPKALGHGRSRRSLGTNKTRPTERRFRPRLSVVAVVGADADGALADRPARASAPTGLQTSLFEGAVRHAAPDPVAERSLCEGEA